MGVERNVLASYLRVGHTKEVKLSCMLRLHMHEVLLITCILSVELKQECIRTGDLSKSV